MKKIQWWKPHSWYREIAVKQGLNPDPIKVARLLEEATGGGGALYGNGRNWAY